MNLNSMDNFARGVKGVEQPPNFTYSQENNPFWRSNGEDNRITSAELLWAFLKDLCDDTGPYLYTEVEIEGFCLPADLNVLETGAIDEVRKPTALLDDRANQGTDIRGKCRPSKGALSAHQLYLELSKPRFVNRPGCSSLTCSGSLPVNPGEPEADAERRLIYITDVDRWNILAIIKTASPRQAGYYKDFIYRHLVYEAFLGVRIPIVPQTYAFEFHLPFYVYRRRACPIQDSRQRADHEPLRNSFNLDFLEFDADLRSRPTLQDCVSEAQVSLIVTGFEQSLVGLCFVDTYYRGSEDNRESVQYYVEEDQESDAEGNGNGFKMDPLSKGILDANKPIWDAKHYFLRNLACRTDQVRKECHNVVYRVLQLLRRYTHSYRLHTDDQSSDRIERFSRQVARFNETIRFLQQLISQLSKTIGAWDSFQKDIDQHFSHFKTLPPSSIAQDPGSLLPTIETHFSELRYLRQEVTYRQQLIESLKQQISQHLQQESNKIANLQHQNGEHMKLLAIIVLIFTPITISSSLFSIDDNSLWFQKSPGSYFLITFCLSIIMLVLSTIMLNWEWHCTLRKWAFSGSRQHGGGWTRVLKTRSLRGRRGSSVFTNNRGIFLPSSDELEMETRIGPREVSP